MSGVLVGCDQCVWLWQRGSTLGIETMVEEGYF